MEIINIKAGELKPAEYNPREMNEFDLDNLKNSIREFGIVEPVVVNKDLTIIGGHQRYRAMLELEWQEIPCIVLDLDKTKEKILNLALNKIVGGWNDEKLARLVKDLEGRDDLQLTGFNEEEVESFIQQYDLVFSNTDLGEEDENLKKAFSLNQRVAIPMERPEATIKKNGVAFYAETIEEFNRVREFFATNSKAELDIKKLISIIDEI